MATEPAEPRETSGSKASPRRGRRPHRSQDQIRELMLAEGFAMLLTLDFPLGLDNIFIEEVIARAAVPRGSGYRAWRSDDDDEPGPQIRFREALAEMVLTGFEADASAHKTLEVARPYLDRLNTPEFLALTPAERGELLIETTRIGFNANYEAVSKDPFLRIQHGLTGIIRMRGLPDPEDPLTQAVVAAGRTKAARYQGLFEHMMDAFGMRVRPGLTLEQFCYGAAALSEGLWLRPNLVDELGYVDADGREWSLHATIIRGILEHFFENDPQNGPETVI